MQKESGTFLTGDLYLSAWLYYRLNSEPVLKRKGHRIIFSFPSSPELYQAISDFNESAKVIPAEFTTLIKGLKGAMYDKKAEGEDR